jgi:threonine dehydrogenase-like Zn-dependent dehydrogenase
MKALCYEGPRDIRYETVADPTIRDRREILVKMTKCGICGSDLHIFHGKSPAANYRGESTAGYSVGHEAVGEVVEIGGDVRRFKPGDMVMLSGAVGCGECSECVTGNVTRCSKIVRCYGLSHDLQGCQAEAIVVPAADFNAAPIPDGLTVDRALMLTDNLPTAYFGCRNAEIRPGKVAAIVGLGPIGLMATECALLLGASRVFAIDLIPARRASAEKIGATALDPATAVEEIAAATSGAMADCVVEAVGADATIKLALQLAGLQGIVSVVGVNMSQEFKFPMAQSMGKGLTFRIGGCSVQYFWPELIPLLQHGRLHPESFISHEMSLSEGAAAYELFDKRSDGALKIVMSA